MGKRESATMGGEEYLKGRRAGIEGTHGNARKGTAERTVVSDGGHDSDSGSHQTDLTSAASSMYKRAVGPGEDTSKMGDQALRDR